jgi:predicted RNA-binding protein with EMAP domain
MTVKTTKTIQKAKKSVKNQKFVRLNLDPDLENLLAGYEIKYKLLSRSDIIRMLLSEVSWSKQFQKRHELAGFLANLPKPKNVFTEGEIMDMVNAI